MTVGVCISFSHSNKINYLSVQFLLWCPTKFSRELLANKVSSVGKKKTAYDTMCNNFTSLEAYIRGPAKLCDLPSKGLIHDRNKESTVLCICPGYMHICAECHCKHCSCVPF